MVILGGVGFFVYKLDLFPSLNKILPSNNSQETWKIKSTNNLGDFTKVAVDKDGNSYVFMNNRVEKIDGSGNKLCESFNPHIAPNPQGDIIVGSTGVYFSGLYFYSKNYYQGGANYSMVKIGNDCEEMWTLGDSAPNNTSITTDEEDAVYIAGYNIITKYNNGGNKMWEINLDETKVFYINSMLFHKNKLYVFAGDEGVMLFDKNGQKIGMADLGSASSGLFDLEDNLYLNEGDGNITKYDKNMTELWTVDVTTDFVQSSVDKMNIDNLGNIYFNLILNGCFNCDVSLYKIDPQGNKKVVYKEDHLRDFDIDSRSNLYITSGSGFGKFSQIEN